MTPPDRAALHIPDEELTRAACDAIRRAMGEAITTVSISARDGEVTLAGTVATLAELRQAEGLVHRLAGVNGVDNLMTVSDMGTRRSRQVAAELQAAVARAYPQARVSVTVFAGIAVLTGSVPTAAVQHGVARTVQRHAEVSRVVDKLQLDGAAASPPTPTTK